VIQENRRNRTREKIQAYVPPNDLDSEVEKDDSGDKEGRQKVEEIINVFKTERNRQLWRNRCREEKPEEDCERTDCVQLSLVMNI
jgi:hypothetical protein